MERCQFDWVCEFVLDCFFFFLIDQISVVIGGIRELMMIIMEIENSLCIKKRWFLSYDKFKSMLKMVKQIYLWWETKKKKKTETYDYFDMSYGIWKNRNECDIYCFAWNIKIVRILINTVIVCVCMKSPFSWGINNSFVMWIISFN